VEYSTPIAKLRELPAIIREVMASVQDIRFERAYFKAFGASDLQYEIVFFVLKPDIGLYMDRQHELNLALFERLGREGVDFAYPTQQVILKKDPTLMVPA